MGINSGIAVFWPDCTPSDIEEEIYCHKFCREFSRNSIFRTFPDASWVEYDLKNSCMDLLDQCKSNIIVMVGNPKILLRGEVVMRLTRLVESGFAACGPVYNLAEVEKQVAEMPYPYLNLTSFAEVCDLMENAPGVDNVKTDLLDTSCLTATREFLKKNVLHWNAESCKMMHGGDMPMAVDPGAMVHNFGEYFSGQRDDLIGLVPPQCRRILDIGCAGGEYGRKLKNLYPDVYTVGVELNPVMAGMAVPHYDQVLTMPVQDIDFSEPFDLVNCGDVLEHMSDPWTLLCKISGLIRQDGHMVLSVPNAGHWTVVMDLLQGRFDYVPWGLLCITHIRWFTEQSIIQALEKAGLEVDIFHRQQVEPTPKGRKFIAEMSSQGLGQESSLLTNELVIRAVKR